MRRWRPSWPAHTPSGPGNRASAWQLRGRARSTSSTGCTTRRWTTSRADAHRLSQQTFLLSEFLAAPAPQALAGRLTGRRALVFDHCHHKSVLGTDAERAVLDASGLEYEALDDAGCCGMAGSFGFERSHYDISMAVGERALLPAVRATDSGTTIIADGFSCREQISQATGRPPRHLAEVLAEALRPAGAE